MKEQEKLREYIATKKDINMKKKAFLSIGIGMLLTLFISLIEFMVEAHSVTLIILGCTIIFFILYKLYSKELDKTPLNRYYFCNGAIVRKTHSFSKWYPVKDIERIKIIRTTAGMIRTMSIYLSDKRILSINSIEDTSFELFREELLSYDNTLSVQVIHERINYDHPLLIPIMGIVIGIINAVFIRWLIMIDNNTYQLVGYIVASLTILVGIIWFILLGRRFKLENIIAGVLIIILGLVLLLYIGK
jgi:sulfite exporter TauE/SafE